MASSIQKKISILISILFLLNSCGLKDKNQKIILLYYGVSTNYFEKLIVIETIVGYIVFFS